MMNRAIELARSVDLRADRNPHVGAVIVSSDGDVVGEGFHRGSGSAHAEVAALHIAGARARGATMYCTLEPCSSHGVMGPCTSALIDAGVARVVYGQADPNPAMAGGAHVLRAAGIDVVHQETGGDCEALNSSWTFAHLHGRPWVIWKCATSLDGYVADSQGRSKWITGEQSRDKVQEMRREVGAVVTGTGTVLADNPYLTVRGSDKQPLRVVVGTRDVSHMTNHSPAITYTVPIEQALQRLWVEHGVHRVLVEAGPGLSSALWDCDAVDEVYWFQAPILLGGGTAVVSNLRHEHRFSDVSVHRVGWDLLYHFTTH